MHDLAAAAFGRLCVETFNRSSIKLNKLAAAFGRLCVETAVVAVRSLATGGSRLRAAVC